MYERSLIEVSKEEVEADSSGLNSLAGIRQDSQSLQRLLDRMG